jgi:hypothetical protein
MEDINQRKAPRLRGGQLRAGGGADRLACVFR